jgi:murein L,D-transpeptidase YcbB/YkuD
MSCGDGEFVYTQERTLDDFKEYRDGAFEVNGDEVIKNLANMAAADQGGLSADKFTRNYYKEKGKPLWIDYKGIDWRVDSLEEWLKATEAVGISPTVFRLKQISEDLETFRSYSFDDTHDINTLIARLDYNLTRAYLRYLSGQRFGFVNPDAVLNRLYKKPEDSLSNKYIRLFDIPLRRANDDFFTMALRCSSADSIIAFVQASQPVGSLYRRLVSELQRNNASSVRQKILCNIERCRWRQKDYPENHEKYVVVNIPSFNLYAVDKEKTIHMRIGCGAVKTKTPLLTSKVVRMDLNPQWIVPKSIAKGIAYSYSYMQKERMFIFDKTRGKLPCTESSL